MKSVYCVCQVTVNPRQQVPESNFNNNVVRCDVQYTGTAAHLLRATLQHEDEQRVETGGATQE
ncbi:hypothetical protein INR49_011497 [Caranx melampygus]|nr:hypothetical protein INR49_011497 [Caranx melampygus]